MTHYEDYGQTATRAESRAARRAEAIATDSPRVSAAWFAGRGRRTVGVTTTRPAPSR